MFRTFCWRSSINGPEQCFLLSSVFCHSHNKSNRGRNTLRSRSAIPNDQEGDHKPKVKRKLKMVCQFYYYMVFRGLILFKIDYHFFWELRDMTTTNNNDFSFYLFRNRYLNMLVFIQISGKYPQLTSSLQP